jgi:8-oxo-dGTP diphosphatase
MFIVNVEGAIFKGDKWLLIERSKKESHAGGMITLVGGKVDLEGDSVDILERTIKREIIEEVGIEINDKVHYVQSTSFVTDKGINVVDIVFLCEYSTGNAYPKSHDEVEQVYWMTYQEIMDHPHAPIWPKESIKKAEIVRRNLFGEITSSIGDE